VLPKQYTVAQVAEYFHRDEVTIRRWIVEGKFPGAYKVADGWYILEISVKRLVRKMQEASAEGMPDTATQAAARRPSGKGFVGGWK